MRLAAVYSVWDDWDWLTVSSNIMEEVVDGIIVVASEKSNYGEISKIPEEWKHRVIMHEPRFNVAMHSETDKRNYGLEFAKRAGYTHFITMDADEIYTAADVNKGKELFKSRPDLLGLVCYCKTYFKYPDLTIGLDSTLVPFIHKLTPDLKHDFNRHYPYAWEGKNIRIDPTRSLNINTGVEMFDATMHHYSWVRKDYEKKIRNSTAKSNLERSTIRQDLALAQEGYFCKFYGKTLIRESADFIIPENVSKS